jgi:hypothetical protein
MGEVAEQRSIEYNAYPVAMDFIMFVGEAAYIQGPFGSGKTVAALWKKYLLGMRAYERYGLDANDKPILRTNGKTVKPLPRRTLVVRNTRTELMDTTFKSFMQWFGDMGEWMETKNRFTFYGTGHEFLFYGLDRPKDVKKALSLEITDFVIDEASEIEHEIFLTLMGRKGRFPKVEGKEELEWLDLYDMGDCVSNPPEDEHWLVDEFELDPKENYRQFLQPGGTQPDAENTRNLPKGYYAKLLEQYRARPDLQARYVHGRRAVIVRGKAVYDREFEKGYHVITERPVRPNTLSRILRGHDNSGNVPAAVAGYLDPSGCLVIEKEFVTDKSGIIDFYSPLVEWCNIEYGEYVEYIDISDPAGHAEYSHPGGGMTSNAKMVLEKFGIKFRKGPVKFAPRREAVSDRLLQRRSGGPAIVIYAGGCPRLVAALEGGYAYPKLPDNRGYGTEPVKNQYSHVAESLQYLCSHLMGKSHRQTRRKASTAKMRGGTAFGRRQL